MRGGSRVRTHRASDKEQSGEHQHHGRQAPEPPRADGLSAGNRETDGRHDWRGADPKTGDEPQAGPKAAEAGGSDEAA
jgi:hypothetical protein